MERLHCFLRLLCAVVLAAAAVSPNVVCAGVSLEQMAMSLFPPERFDHIAGFFGPVTKRYQPVFYKFCHEYNSADDKLAIAQKYMPQAEKALDEARRMRVPPRYEAEKAKYIKMFEMLLASAKLSVKFAEKTGMGRGASK